MITAICLYEAVFACQTDANSDQTGTLIVYSLIVCFHWVDLHEFWHCMQFCIALQYLLYIIR